MRCDFTAIRASIPPLHDSLKAIFLHLQIINGHGLSIHLGTVGPVDCKYPCRWC